MRTVALLVAMAAAAAEGSACWGNGGGGGRECRIEERMMQPMVRSCFVQGLSIVGSRKFYAPRPRHLPRTSPHRGRGAGELAMHMWGFLPPQKDDGIPPPPMVEISKEAEFESLLMQAATLDKLLVLDCYASWCRVCVFLEVRIICVHDSL